MTTQEQVAQERRERAAKRWQERHYLRNRLGTREGQGMMSYMDGEPTLVDIATVRPCRAIMELGAWLAEGEAQREKQYSAYSAALRDVAKSIRRAIKLLDDMEPLPQCRWDCMFAEQRQEHPEIPYGYILDADPDEPAGEGEQPATAD